MGWHDRDYNRYGGERGAGSFFRNVLFGSVPLGTWWGIRVRVHASLVLLIGVQLLMASTREGVGIQNALTSSAILFGLVLAHEFGHCTGARMVGGHAEDILLWPLGGLASIETPRRPWPAFVGTVCGPLVNVVVCAGTGLALLALTHFQYRLPMDPLLPFAGGRELSESTLAFYVTSQATYYLWWIYSTSWMLLVFNLLPIFPMDGGRMMQEILWPFVGYRRSMNFACITGMVGAVLLAAVGLARLASGGGSLLIFLGVCGFMACYQMRMMLQADGGEDYSEPWEGGGGVYPPKRKVRKGWFRDASRRAANERAEQAKIDAILTKVHERGLHSLNWWEKRTLRKATEKQRQRDLAERL